MPKDNHSNATVSDGFKIIFLHFSCKEKNSKINSKDILISQNF